MTKVTASLAGHTPVIAGTGSYVPERVRSSDDIARQLGLPPGWIEERTGVSERRMADSEQATSDLATEAARRALNDASVRGTDIRLIILATSTPDNPLPATACQVQANLQASAACAMDLDAVCSGFVFALDVAQKMMRCDPSLAYALVIGADTYSRILDYSDRRTCVLFGDGAGAVVLSRSMRGGTIEFSRLGSDGTLNRYVEIVGGGSRRPLTPESLADGEQYFRMNGRAVKEFAHDRVPTLVQEALAAQGLFTSDIDAFIPHQANVRIITEVAKQLGFSQDQLVITADTIGNTGAASVPITLDRAIREGRLNRTGRALLAAVGGGMTWGSMILRWPIRNGGEELTR